MVSITYEKKQNPYWIPLSKADIEIDRAVFVDCPTFYWLCGGKSLAVKINFSDTESLYEFLSKHNYFNGNKHIVYLLSSEYSVTQGKKIIRNEYIADLISHNSDGNYLYLKLK